LTALHPATDSHDRGGLDVGEGNRIYWETSGDPEGQPAVLLHGGPGSGSSPGARRLFDPRAYRIVQFDQRGCGRSTPHASEPGTDLSVNTTEHLLADIEKLRVHLAVERWLVFGVSWGCTLALAYAERHSERVRALVLAGVTMTRRSEIEWLYRRIAPLFPEEWERFAGGVPESERGGDLVEAYSDLLHSADAAVRERAARDWHDWEAASLSRDPAARAPADWSDPDFRLARARIVTHYFSHAAWLEDGALLRGAPALADVPGVMVQGRVDLQGPLVTAWELARAWPAGDLVVVPNAGHSARDPGMTKAIVAATDRFAVGG